MPTPAAFRLSIYLTLALACSAVGYAEASLLIEAPVVALLVIVALAVLYRLETRVDLLTIPAANRLGLIVGLASVVWAIVRVLREINDPQMQRMDWPVMGLALTGPFVMTLIPAKLARREKHSGDYWWLEGMGLAAAALAGAMADDLIAFVLIGAYTLCAIWSVSLFALLRAAGSIQPIPGQEPPPRVAGVVSSGRSRLGLAVPIALLGFGAAVAVPLYLLTPRSTFAKLEFGKPRVEIGYAADQMVDLTQVGELRPNNEIAFEVYAETAAGPKTDLSPDQRWRGQVKGRYQGGQWPDSIDQRLPAVAPGPGVRSDAQTPKVWPDQTTLTFTVMPGARGRFLADPVTWSPQGPAPVASITPWGYHAWIWSGTGSFIPESRVRSYLDRLHYVQAWRPELDADLSPPVQLIEHDTESVLRPLRMNPVRKVKDYADGVIREMVRDGRLPEDHLDRVSMLPRREFHDRIARALTTHLATTPTLTYTTDLRRANRDVDPIEDFLFYTRAGHCERFASALVLMLRSQGIPALLVLGFKGCEPTGEPGHYIVRQEHAHAWVEAFIEDDPVRPWWQVWRTSRWRSLDPTPSGAPAVARSGGWMDRTRQLFDTYVIEYSPEERLRAMRGIVAALSQPRLLGAIAAIALAAWIGRRLLRARSIPRPTTPAGRWFDRLLTLLAPHGLHLRPGETAREFAVRAGEMLRSRAAGESAEVPLEWAEAYYEVRFGGRSLSTERRAELDDRLTELRRALSGQRPLTETSA